MSPPTVLVTRPQAEAEATAFLLRQRGFQSLVSPLLHREVLQPSPLTLEIIQSIQAIIITSQAALHSFPQQEALRDKPLYTVGDHSARVATSYGFHRVKSACGTAHDLLQKVTQDCNPAQGPLLYVSGKNMRVNLPEHLSAQGFQVIHQISYQMTPVQNFEPSIQEAFRQRAIQAVLLLSPQTGQCFSTCVQRASLKPQLQTISLLCLSEAVAISIQPCHPAIVRIAPHPNLASLMEILDEVLVA